jgi:hypothetical protein
MEKVLTSDLVFKMCDQAFKPPIMNTVLPGRNDDQARGRRYWSEPVPVDEITDRR